MNICKLRKMNNNNLNTLMKLKYNLLLAAFIIVLSICIGVSTQAQGIYSTDTNEKKVENTETNQSGDIGSGLFRGIGDGGSGDDKPDDPGGPDEPIGEGILILSLLSGTYALVKRNLKRKHEN